MRNKKCQYLGGNELLALKKHLLGPISNKKHLNFYLKSYLSDLPDSGSLQSQK